MSIVVPSAGSGPKGKPSGLYFFSLPSRLPQFYCFFFLSEIKAFHNTDFSDCPELTDDQLSQLKSSHYRNMANYKPIKKSVNVRIDADVLEWLKNAGTGYQTRLNAILRHAMEDSITI